MTRTLSSLALLLAIALGTPAPSEALKLSPTVTVLRGAPDRGAAVAHREPAAWPGNVSSNLTVGAPTPTGSVGTALIGGFATWYADPKQPPDRRYAAAGPLLRQALGHWRGRTILVTSGNRSTLTTIIDFCACGDRHGTPTVLDLSPASFADLGSLDAGLIRVEIEIADPPRTDTDLRMQREVADDSLYR